MTRSPAASPRTFVRRALAPSLAALVLLAACVVNLDFDYTVTGQAVQAVAQSNTVNAAVVIDLSQQPDIAAHRANIQSLSLNSLDMTITAVQTDNNVTGITGTLSLRPDGATDASQDVLVGALNGFSIAVNSGVHLVGSSALDTFALNTIHGSGKFSAIISGTSASGNTADFSVDIKLTMSMGYDTGI